MFQTNMLRLGNDNLHLVFTKLAISNEDKYVPGMKSVELFDITSKIGKTKEYSFFFYFHFAIFGYGIIARIKTLRKD